MGDSAQMTVAAIREGQRAAVVMMLTRQASGLATAAPSSTAAPACQNAITQMHTHAHATINTHTGMHMDPMPNDKDILRTNVLELLLTIILITISFFFYSLIHLFVYTMSENFEKWSSKFPRTQGGDLTLLVLLN